MTYEAIPTSRPITRGIAITFGAAIVGAHLTLALASCSGGRSSVPALPTTPREQARATVLVLAEGVREADQRCADVGREAGNLVLLDRCTKAYDTARGALLVAAGAVDAYDDGRQGDVACATATGIDAALELAGLIRSAGGDLPAALDDGLRLAKQFGAECKDGGL